MIALYFKVEPKVVEDFLKEVEKWEALEEIKSFGEAKDKITAKIAKMESKLLDKMTRIETIFSSRKKFER